MPTEQGKNCVFLQPPLHTDDRTLCYTNHESAPCGTEIHKVKMNEIIVNISLLILFSVLKRLKKKKKKEACCNVSE